MDYLDIVWNQNHRSRARDVHSIPEWFTRFWIEEEWIGADEYTELDTGDSHVAIEMRYAHREGRCYQIREYCVYDWRVTVRMGTLCFRLRVDIGELNRAERFAIRFLLDSTADAVAGYHDPTGSVAGGLVDIGLIAAGSAIPPIFGDLASGLSMGQLLDDIQDISDRVEERLREIRRLRDLDGVKIAEYPDVVWRRRWERVKSYSSFELIEIECADWVLEIPEGEVIAVPDHDEQVYPPAPLAEDLEEEFRHLRDLAGAERARAGGGLERIKETVDRLRRSEPGKGGR